MPIRSALTAGALLWGLLRFALLAVLFLICFALGGSIVGPALPTLTPEPGPLPLMPALFVISAASALVVGLMFSVPQNVGHILPNSLLPLNSVRLSHLVETVSSTFIFGLIVSWLLYPTYGEARATQPQIRPVEQRLPS